MKKSASAVVAVRIAILYCIFFTLCQGARAQNTINFRLVRDTFVVVSLNANGQGPFEFLLDTGTNTTILDPALASRLGLASQGQVELGTLNGSEMVPRSSLNTLSAGLACVPDVEVLIQDLGELKRLDSQIAGIIGQNFLSHFNFLLDYRKRTLRVEVGNEIRAGIEGKEVTVDASEGKMIVASEAQGFGHAKLKLLLDSGASSILLIHRATAALTLPMQANWQESTSVGRSGVQVSQIRSLTVGSQVFRDVTVAIPAASAVDAERIEDGVMPIAMFQSLYVNNHENFVVFNPKTKKN
jgi:predicted aspartyl protease